jgi:hypothetical protein
MKTITGVLVLSALVVPSTPAAAQGNLAYQIERIVDYSLTIAADALGDLVDDRASRDRDERQDRQRGPGARGDRGPEFTEMFTKTVRLGRNGRLELDNLSGDVEVTGNGGDDVKITATKRVHAPNESAGRGALNAIEIQVTDRAGVVSISAGPTRGRFSSGEIDYIISVPTGTNLSLKTVSGDVSVRNITGDLVVNSFSGDVVVGDARPRAIEIELVSGDVSLEKVDSERVHVKSVSGDIILTGKLAKTGRYDISTHSGDIQVIPEGNPGFDLEAATFSGDVSSDFGLRLGGGRNNLNPGDRGSRRNNNIRGTVNDGGATLSLHTFSGDILITKR